ncbi:MAG TPA: hypothetical protein VJH68_04020 [Candidatus Nanoarchaeia archaeon]|nr:hypothetical protein [Candidatus Nanoarchaeia archaeon]
MDNEIDLEYCTAHTFKNSFWRGFDTAVRDIVVDSLVGLRFYVIIT